MADTEGEVPAPQPVFDPNAAHQQKPRLRPVRGFGAEYNGQQVLGLSDARQISDKVVFTSPAAQFLLPLMDGSRTLDEIVATTGRGLTRQILEQLVAQLDGAGLLFGPTYEGMLAKMRADFDSSPVLPPATTAQFVDQLVEANLPKEATDEEKAAAGPVKLRELLDQWCAEALKSVENPSFDVLPKAIIVPHIDYPRGWINYAHVWGRLRVVDRPDRVIILGTNHFGECTGVCGCDKGFSTPLGVCNVDQGVVDGLRSRLGDTLFAHRFDHEREHSIELQIPWIQHVFGTDEAGNYPKIFAALVHDPVINEGNSYDGTGIGLDPFVDALRETLAGLPGKTLVISSADLSHVGPSFGDEQPLAGEEEAPTQARNKVFQHDQEMIQLIAQNNVDELLGAMAWQQNPTRWCSTGNIVATLKLVQPAQVSILNYSAAMDGQGQGMVSSLAASMS
jgi:hypothetical protein